MEKLLTYKQAKRLEQESLEGLNVLRSYAKNHSASQTLLQFQREAFFDWYLRLNTALVEMGWPEETNG